MQNIFIREQHGHKFHMRSIVPMQDLKIFEAQAFVQFKYHYIFRTLSLWGACARAPRRTVPGTGPPTVVLSWQLQEAGEVGNFVAQKLASSRFLFGQFKPAILPCRVLYVDCCALEIAYCLAVS